jgi:hypothetical protein
MFFYQTIRRLVDLIYLISLLSLLSFGSMLIVYLKSNSPIAVTHLICFFRNQPKPVFYVASRGHHADIGGITPGSMPPHSHTLNEEGAVFTRFLLLLNKQTDLRFNLFSFLFPASCWYVMESSKRRNLLTL